MMASVPGCRHPEVWRNPEHDVGTYQWLSLVCTNSSGHDHWRRRSCWEVVLIPAITPARARTYTSRATRPYVGNLFSRRYFWRIPCSFFSLVGCKVTWEKELAGRKEAVSKRLHSFFSWSAGGTRTLDNRDQDGANNNALRGARSGSPRPQPVKGEKGR